MKVKLFSIKQYEIEDFENSINEFIKDKKIIDIKYSTLFNGPKKSFDHVEYSVLIMYED